jgi:hypothetical protein
MPYAKKISRAEPGHVIFVLDDSGSMADNLPGTSDAKFQWTERYFGIVLKELLARSTEMKGDAVAIKPRYYVTTIIYGSQPQLWGSECMGIQATVEQYAKANNSLGLGGKMGGTDAAAALLVARDVLAKAVLEERFKTSFPPLLFHLTDGMSATDPTRVADEIRRLATADGNALMVNAFIGTQTSLAYKGSEDFPGYVDADEAGPGEDNLRLFRMSSEVPDCIRANLIEDGIFPKLRPGARLFFDVRTREMLKHVLQVVGSLGSRADRQAR